MRGVLYLLLHPKRLLILVTALLGSVAYVWVAAVRAVPRVKERKEAARRSWHERDRAARRSP